jgi:NADPH-dependent curcumin reductase CurA
MSGLLVTRSSVHGFLFSDWWHRRDEAIGRLADWHRAGKLTVRQDVIDGLEKMPTAFLRLLKGENFGKQLVRIH